MNVIETIRKEMDGKDYTEFEKLRYIYIRCCELFYFDSRWAYTDLFNDRELKCDIYAKRIDLTNVDDFAIMCHTFAREVLVPVIKALTSLNAKHIESKAHSIVLIEGLDGQNWVLDAARGDLSRVKMNIHPVYMNGDITVSPRGFIKTDKLLGYNFYDKQFYPNLVKGENIKDKFRTVGYLLSENDKVKKNYSDSNFFVNTCTSFMYCDGTTYVDRDYNFHKLIIVSNGKAYYDLSKDDDSYSLKEIDKDRHDYLTKTLICKTNNKR